MSTAIHAVAEALLKARETNQTADTSRFLDALVGPEDAYAVQAIVAARLGWHDGQVGRHWKSGGAARDAIITHAALVPAGIWRSPAAAGNWPLHLHGVEAEIAIRLNCDVTPAMAATADPLSAQAWVSEMAVAIEVISTHWDMGYDTPSWLKLADLQAHGALVIADWQPWRDIDWDAQSLEIKVNGQTVDTRTGSHPLGHPTWGLPAFLKHATREGQTVARGCVITTGSWNGVYRAAAGDAVTVTFDGIGDAILQF